MMFKTIIFSGFLFATACATGVAPNIATMELQPNLDQSLIHKEFRVLYSGVGVNVDSSSVSIKISKDSEEVVTYTVDQEQVNTPKAYYFGYYEATAGEYKVEVCAGSTCSEKNPALTVMQADHQDKKVTCIKGQEEDVGGKKQWVKKEDIVLDVIGAETWITHSDIQNIEKTFTELSSEKTPYETEWSKNSVNSNPSYDQTAKRLYAGVMYDIAHYRQLFMKKDAPGATAPYAHDFCKRKYLLSYHVHVLEKKTHEVVHRSKRTLYMSKGGKEYFIYTNTAPVGSDKRRKVHVELTFNGLNLDMSNNKKYEVWISFCATEKDVNESTVCSDPKITDLKVE